MKNLYSFHFLKIDLDSFQTYEELVEILVVNGITTEKISPRKLFDLKKTYITIFYDPITYSIVAYIKRGQSEIKFVKELIQLFNSTVALSSEISELTVDDILDKISRRGLDALSTQEIEFLKQNSKK